MTEAHEIMDTVYTFMNQQTRVFNFGERDYRNYLPQGSPIRQQIAQKVQLLYNEQVGMEISFEPFKNVLNRILFPNELIDRKDSSDGPQIPLIGIPLKFKKTRTSASSVEPLEEYVLASKLDDIDMRLRYVLLNVPMSLNFPMPGEPGSLFQYLYDKIKEKISKKEVFEFLRVTFGARYNRDWSFDGEILEDDVSSSSSSSASPLQAFQQQFSVQIREGYRKIKGHTETLVLSYGMHESGVEIGSEPDRNYTNHEINRLQELLDTCFEDTSAKLPTTEKLQGIHTNYQNVKNTKELVRDMTTAMPGANILKDLIYLAEIHIAVRKMRQYLLSKDFVLSILHAMFGECGFAVDTYDVKVDQALLLTNARHAVREARVFNVDEQNRDICETMRNAYNTIQLSELPLTDWEGDLNWNVPAVNDLIDLSDAQSSSEATDNPERTDQSQTPLNGNRPFAGKVLDKSTLSVIRNVYWDPNTVQMLRAQCMDIISVLTTSQEEYMKRLYTAQATRYNNGKFEDRVKMMFLRSGRSFFKDIVKEARGNPPTDIDFDTVNFETELSDVFTLVMVQDLFTSRQSTFTESLAKAKVKACAFIDSDYMRHYIDRSTLNLFTKPKFKSIESVNGTSFIDSELITMHNLVMKEGENPKNIAQQLLKMQEIIKDKLRKNLGLEITGFDITGTLSLRQFYKPTKRMNVEIADTLFEDTARVVRILYTNFLTGDDTGFATFKKMFFHITSFVCSFLISFKEFGIEDIVYNTFAKIIQEGYTEFDLETLGDETISTRTLEEGFDKSAKNLSSELMFSQTLKQRQSEMSKFVSELGKRPILTAEGREKNIVSALQYTYGMTKEMFSETFGEQKLKAQTAITLKHYYTRNLVIWGGMLATFLKPVGENKAFFCARILNTFHKCEATISKAQYEEWGKWRKERVGFLDAIKHYDKLIAESIERLSPQRRHKKTQKQANWYLKRKKVERRALLVECFNKWYSKEEKKIKGFQTLGYVNLLAKVAILATACYFEGTPFDGILTVLWKQFKTGVKIYGEYATLRYEDWRDLQSSNPRVYWMRVPKKTTIQTLFLRQIAFLDGKMCVLNTGEDSSEDSGEESGEGHNSLFTSGGIKVSTWTAKMSVTESSKSTIYDEEEGIAKKLQNETVNNQLAYRSIDSNDMGPGGNLKMSASLDDSKVELGQEKYDPQHFYQASVKHLLSEAEKMDDRGLSCIGWKIANSPINTSVNFVGNEWFVCLSNPIGGGAKRGPIKCFNKHSVIKNHEEKIRKLIDDTYCMWMTKNGSDLPEKHLREAFYRKNLNAKLLGDDATSNWDTQNLNYCYRLGNFYDILMKYSKIDLADQVSGTEPSDISILKNAAKAVFDKIPESALVRLKELLHKGEKVGTEFVQYLSYNSELEPPVKNKSVESTESDKIFGITSINKEFMKKWSGENKTGQFKRLDLREYVGLVFLVHEAVLFGNPEFPSGFYSPPL